MNKTYVLDTSALLTDSRALLLYEENDIIIPLKVLEEIDNHKKRFDGVGLNSRLTIRYLDEMRSKGSLYDGVPIEEGKGTLYVKGYDPKSIPNGLNPNDADNQIIATAITEKSLTGKDVIVVSRDINMRVKCDSIGLESEDFTTDQVVQDTSDLYDGLKMHAVDDQIIDQYYNGEDIFFEKEEALFHPNQFVMLVSNQNQKKSALAKFKDYNSPLSRVVEYQKKGIWGLRPRNKEQQFALDLLMDDNIPIVTINGKAGCGKTLLAIAAGLEQTIEQNKFKKLVVSRPIMPLGKDIGFLPGEIEEKMKPWLMPIQDNLDFLFDSQYSKENCELLFSNGTISVEALTYIRGRSISKAYIIIDEAQNLTIHELKTIITRVGEDSKIVLTGDIEQIDNTYIDSITNGLSYAVEKFKGQTLAGHVTLKKGERSKIATLAAKIL